MKIRRIDLRIICLLCCLAGIAPAFAQGPAVRYTFSHPQMGTVIRLVFYSATDSAGARSVAEKVFARVDSLNAVFSDYLPESELNRLCDRAGDGGKVLVSKDLWDILRMSATYSEMTDGAFDVTVGAVTRLWRKARMMKELPDSSRLAAAVSTVDYRYVRLYKKRRAMIANKGTRLDLGGIAQGYTADECLRMLRAAGIPSALVDVGGDIALGDLPPAAKGWIIESPVAGENGNVTADTLILSNCGITTSGASYRHLEINGVRYSHIIDPRTGQGLTHRNWVIIKAPTATDADAWATALSVLGEQEWEKLKSKHVSITAWIREAPL